MVSHWPRRAARGTPMAAPSAGSEPCCRKRSCV
jgi:hypothetical protein